MVDQTRTLSLVLNLIRSGEAVTRPELARHSGLGRTTITQRVDDAIAEGLVEETPQAVSTGGRPSRVLRLSKSGGWVLAAVFGVSRLHVAITDLTGELLADDYLRWDIEQGPEASLAELRTRAERLLGDHRDRLWAACVGLPGPVDYTMGRPVVPPLMPGWDGYPVRETLEAAFNVPVWVDNDTNLMALGTWSKTRRAAGDNVVFIKAGTGLGAGLISRGHLHRGARGAAGDFGHLIIADESRMRCRCGKFGCLEAYAGGWALARDARAAALTGRSDFLRKELDSRADLTVDDVILGFLDGDATCRELVLRSAELVGAQLATLVSHFNPSTVFLGGNLTRVGNEFRDTIVAGVQRRSLPLATSDLVVADVPLRHYEGVIGAAWAAVDELLQPEMLSLWIDRGSPRSLRAGTEGTAEPWATEKRHDFLTDLSDRENGLAPLSL